MLRRWCVGATVAGALFVALAVGARVHAAPATAASACPKSSVAAVIEGKHTCLKVGQRCKRALDARYHRYGFHCHATGRLTRPAPAAVINPKLTVAGPEQVVYDVVNACAAGDEADGGVRAFRDASGQVQMILPSIGSNRRMIGPDLDHLTHDCTVTLTSNQNPDPAAYDNGNWLASVYSPDGTTVYGLTHMEYIGGIFPGMCPVSTWPGMLRCWWNSIGLVISTDGGRSYHRAPQRKGLVGAIPYRYDPSGIGLEGMGLNGITQIVRNPGDGYYYTISGDVIAPRNGEQFEKSYNCLMRTKDLGDPTSWRGWDGIGFNVDFIDPYTQPADAPNAHICAPLDIPGQSNNLSLSWNTFLKRWLIVYQNPGGGYWFTTSTDLIRWRAPEEFLDRPNIWNAKCGDATETLYASLLDSTSTSRNFETTGERPYFYFTVYPVTWSDCSTPVRDGSRLVRVPLDISK